MSQMPDNRITDVPGSPRGRQLPGQAAGEGITDRPGPAKGQAGREAQRPGQPDELSRAPRKGGLLMGLGAFGILSAGLSLKALLDVKFDYGPLPAVVGLALGATAWALAGADLAKMRAGRAEARGEGLTLGARRLGRAAVALAALGLVLWGLRALGV